MNKYKGRVTDIFLAKLHEEVEVKIGEDVSVFALLTKGTVKKTKLSEGDEVLVTIKTADVHLEKVGE